LVICCLVFYIYFYRIILSGY